MRMRTQGRRWKRARKCDPHEPDQSAEQRIGERCRDEPAIARKHVADDNAWKSGCLDPDQRRDETTRYRTSREAMDMRCFSRTRMRVAWQLSFRAPFDHVRRQGWRKREELELPQSWFYSSVWTEGPRRRGWRWGDPAKGRVCTFQFREIQRPRCSVRLRQIGPRVAIHGHLGSRRATHVDPVVCGVVKPREGNVSRR